jgi:penicillin-insensitive murein endopeptidase
MRRALIIVLALPLAAAAVFVLYIGWLGIDSGLPSVCRGNVVTGSLERGRRLPYSGDNFRAYSLLGYVAGRTFVHSKVRDAMRDSYAELARTHPELRFLYAETGWPWGGRFAPHRTHANGTAVDFHVPVRAQGGEVTVLPSSPFNKLGYNVEFDGAGRSGSLAIDFEAMGLHLLSLEKAALTHGIRIRRIIFDVGLQAKLAASRNGAVAVRQLPFSKAAAWVRHDEHYHVEFDVPCR